MVQVWITPGGRPGGWKNVVDIVGLVELVRAVVETDAREAGAVRPRRAGSTGGSAGIRGYF
jgi:hypothetical protein